MAPSLPCGLSCSLSACHACRSEGTQIKSPAILGRAAGPSNGKNTKRLERWQVFVKAARQPSDRRFPPPWSIEELDACFIVKDSSGQKLGYFYFEEEPGRRSRLAGVSRVEAVFRAHVGDDREVLAASD
jgi:hypothetical protein